jgi:hypothetical protein
MCFHCVAVCLQRIECLSRALQLWQDLCRNHVELSQVGNDEPQNQDANACFKERRDSFRACVGGTHNHVALHMPGSLAVIALEVGVAGCHCATFVIINGDKIQGCFFDLIGIPTRIARVSRDLVPDRGEIWQCRGRTKVNRRQTERRV